MKSGLSPLFLSQKSHFLGSKNKLPSFFKVKQPVFNVTYSGAANRYCRDDEYVNVNVC